MSSLPLSSTPTLAYLNASLGFVQVQSTSTSPLVVSWLDGVSGLGAKQLTASLQPSFKNAGLANHPDLLFGGTQYLSFDSLAGKVGQSFTVFLVASLTTPATLQDLFTLGTSTSAVDGYVRLSVSGSAAGFAAHNNAGTGPNLTTGGTVDTKAHLYTLSMGNGTLSLNLDGVNVASASVSGTFSFDRCTLGGFSANGSVSNIITGEIAECAVYGGVADIAAIEPYFLAKYAL